MFRRVTKELKRALENLKLNRKIQLLLMLIIIPMFVLFVFLFFNMYSFNQKYDRIIANAAEAGRFSINFRKDFDYTIYLLIAGHSSFEERDPYPSIDEARGIAYDLINNASSQDNKRCAETIMQLLNNLEKYTRRIEENKRIGGHYDDNINIWEKDVQLVTALIQSNVLEYTYYETKGMEMVRSEVSASLEKITLYSIIVFAMLVIASLIMSFFIPNSIVKPIHHLNDITNQVAKGDLTVRANTLKGAEVRQLGNSLNSMIEKIDNLLTEVKNDETSLREAELELLQAQINPHFLYNTLDTIIWLAESGKQKKVVDMVSTLSDFFRTSLNHGTGMFTLKEEELHLHSYLHIQQVRYQDILDYEIDIPEIYKGAIIPKITLQPIVENALYHGIKNRRGMGRIVVSAVRFSDDLIITIEDNGVGMSEEKLKEIRRRINRTKVNANSVAKHISYGLYNVNERIKLKFGNKYGLSITSILGEGTRVDVKIPFKETES